MKEAARAETDTQELPLPEAIGGPDRSSAPHRRSAGAIAFGITLILGLICYGLFFRRGVWLSVVGYSVAPSERVMHGEVPYRDFLYNYTPGTLWINASLMKLLGVSLVTVNVGLLVFKLATLLTLFRLAKRVTNAWVALIPVGLTLAWLGHNYIFAVVPTQYSLVFVLAALSLMLTYDRKGGLASLFLSGICIGIVLVFKYNVGLLTLASGTAAIGIREFATPEEGMPASQRLRLALKRSLMFWAGFGIVLSAFVAYMAFNHALGAMIQHFLHHASEYNESRSVALPPLKHLGPAVAALCFAVFVGWFTVLKTPRLFGAFLILLLGIGCFLMLIPGRAYIIKISATAAVAYMPLALFGGVAAAVVWSLATRSGDGQDLREWWQGQGTMILVALFTLGAYLEVFPRADEYHLVRVLPAVFLLLILLIYLTYDAATKYSERYPAIQTWVVGWCGAVPVVFLLIVGVRNTWLPHFDSQGRFKDRTALTTTRAQGMFVSDKQAVLIEGLARAIEENSAPDEPMFSFAQRGSGFYFLSGRSNPTRFVWWRSVGIDNQERESVLAMIAGKGPRLILLQDSLSNRGVRDTVTANYNQITAAGGIGVYAMKPH